MTFLPLTQASLGIRKQDYANSSKAGLATGRGPDGGITGQDRWRESHWKDLLGRRGRGWQSVWRGLPMPLPSPCLRSCCTQCCTSQSHLSEADLLKARLQTICHGVTICAKVNAVSYFGYCDSAGVVRKDFTPSQDCCGFLKSRSVGLGDSTVPADGGLSVDGSDRSHVRCFMSFPPSAFLYSPRDR
jgi:hypothetical protein